MDATVLEGAMTDGCNLDVHDLGDGLVGQDC